MNQVPRPSALDAFQVCDAASQRWIDFGAVIREPREPGQLIAFTVIASFLLFIMNRNVN